MDIYYLYYIYYILCTSSHKKSQVKQKLYNAMMELTAVLGSLLLGEVYHDHNNRISR